MPSLLPAVRKEKDTHQKLEGRRAIVRPTENDDRGVVPEPLHILLSLKFHRLCERVVCRILRDISTWSEVPSNKLFANLPAAKHEVLPDQYSQF